MQFRKCCTSATSPFRHWSLLGSGFFLEGGRLWTVAAPSTSVCLCTVCVSGGYLGVLSGYFVLLFLK